MIDSAAAEFIRTARIRIDEIELLTFRPGADTETASMPATGLDFLGEDPGIRKEDANATDGDHRENAMNLRINVTDNSHLGLPEAIIRIRCSKGTYIRAFARDLGEALQSGAHLSSLQRSRSGDFKVEDALDMTSASRLFL